MVVADSARAMRVLETSHPPSWYVPPQDVHLELLTGTRRTTVCEWKGQATYWTLRVGGLESVDVAWSYPSPYAAFATITDYIAFYPGRVDACYVDEERVSAQPGGFYGGWITSDVVGPFKGDPGTAGW
jgi:uncharacterized protein (DUF427 family)